MAGVGKCIPKRSSAGFTLVELIAVVAILAIMGTLVAGAMLTGMRVMNTTTASSNGAVLQQTIDTALSDVLRYASVHADEGYGDVFIGPVFDTDSYYDATGTPVREGYLGVVDGRICLVTPNGGTCTVPKSEGVYTDFTIEESSFTIEYQCSTNLFVCSYTILGPENYVHQCRFTCRTLSEETQIQY